MLQNTDKGGKGMDIEKKWLTIGVGMFFLCIFLFMSNVAAETYTVGNDSVNSNYRFAEYERQGYATFPAHTDVEWRYDNEISGIITRVYVNILPQWGQQGHELNPISHTEFYLTINGEYLGGAFSRVGNSLMWYGLSKLVDGQQVVFELCYNVSNPKYYALGLRDDDVDSDGKIEFHGDLGTDYGACPPYNGVYDYGLYGSGGQHPAANSHDIAYEFMYLDIPNNPPIANFTYSPTEPTTQDFIQFIDTSTDFDGDVVYWSWTFGDGTSPITICNPVHQFDKSGEYYVALNVRDDDGYGDYIYKVIIVKTVTPHASFSYFPSNPTTEDVVQFYDVSTDLDGTINTWSWTFGDGTTSIEQNPTHQYSTSGTFTVTLEILDSDDATDSISKTILIQKSTTEEPADEQDDTDDETSEDETHEDDAIDDNVDETPANNNNTGDTEETPSFEFIVVIIAIALVLFLRRKDE